MRGGDDVIKGYSKSMDFSGSQQGSGASNTTNNTTNNYSYNIDTMTPFSDMDSMVVAVVGV